MRSRWDGTVHILKKRTVCSTPSTVYRIHCSCPHLVEYVGSAKNRMSRIYSKHKSDLRARYWAACGLARHFGHHPQEEMEEAIARLEVTLLDHLPGPFNQEKVLEKEQEWMHKLDGWN